MDLSLRTINSYDTTASIRTEGRRVFEGDTHEKFPADSKLILGV